MTGNYRKADGKSGAQKEIRCFIWGKRTEKMQNHMGLFSIGRHRTKDKQMPRQHIS